MRSMHVMALLLPFAMLAATTAFMSRRAAAETPKVYRDNLTPHESGCMFAVIERQEKEWFDNPIGPVRLSLFMLQVPIERRIQTGRVFSELLVQNNSDEMRSVYAIGTKPWLPLLRSCTLACAFEIDEPPNAIGISNASRSIYLIDKYAYNLRAAMGECPAVEVFDFSGRRTRAFHINDLILFDQERFAPHSDSIPWLFAAWVDERDGNLVMILRKDLLVRDAGLVKWGVQQHEICVLDPRCGKLHPDTCERLTYALRHSCNAVRTGILQSLLVSDLRFEDIETLRYLEKSDDGSVAKMAIAVMLRKQPHDISSAVLSMWARQSLHRSETTARFELCKFLMCNADYWSSEGAAFEFALDDFRNGSRSIDVLGIFFRHQDSARLFLRRRLSEGTLHDNEHARIITTLSHAH